MFGRNRDPRPPLDRAIDAASGLRAGSWECVESLAMLSVEAAGRPEARAFYEAARETSEGLAAGSWDSVRGLTWLARAERELAQREPT